MVVSRVSALASDEEGQRSRSTSVILTIRTVAVDELGTAHLDLQREWIDERNITQAKTCSEWALVLRRCGPCLDLRGNVIEGTTRSTRKGPIRATTTRVPVSTHIAKAIGTKLLTF